MALTRIQARRAVRADRQQPMVRVDDLAAGMRDPALLVEQNATTPKPREMIEQVKIVGRDNLTAADQAVYEGLLAWAMKTLTAKPEDGGGDREMHQIPLDAILSYSGLPSPEALVESLDRLAATRAKYDIRDGEWHRIGSVPLIFGEVAKHLLTPDRSHVNFGIPEPVRRLMLKPKSYGYLELAALPRFASRYSTRLYQRLALRAGYTRDTVGPWEVTPQALAAAMNFTWTRYTDFKRVCLDPALADIALHVRRFTVTVTPLVARPKRGTAKRGRPEIGLLRFDIRPVVGPVVELKAIHFTVEEARYIERPDDRIPVHLMPTAAIVSRLVTYRRATYPDARREMSAAQIGNHWRAAVLEALSGEMRADARAPQERNDLVGADLLATVEERGLGEAMRLWLDMTEWTGRYMTHTDPAAPEPAPVVSLTGSNTFTADDLIAAGHRGLHSISAEDREAMAPVERISFVARRTALSMLEDLDTSGRVFLTSICDGEMQPWTQIEVLDEAVFAVLRKALRVLRGRVSTDMSGVKQSIKNLLEAVAVLDLARVRKISGAIIGSGS